MLASYGHMKPEEENRLRGECRKAQQISDTEGLRAILLAKRAQEEKNNA